MLCETTNGRPRCLAQAAWALSMGLSAAAAIIILAWLHPPLPGRIAATAMPLACSVMWIRCLLRDLRQLDELQRRILLEAASIGCVGIFAAGNLYPVFQHAGLVGRLQSYYVVFAVMGLVSVGYFLANRHYR